MKTIKISKHTLDSVTIYTVETVDLRNLSNIKVYGNTEKEANSNFRNKILAARMELEEVLCELNDSNHIINIPDWHAKVGHPINGGTKDNNNIGQINRATGESSINATQIINGGIKDDNK